MCIYVESHTRRGGDPATVQVRTLEKSLPLTLRENFSVEGHLSSDTHVRDIRKIEDEFQVIINHLRQGATVCLPTLPLADVFTYLEKRTPKVEGYLSKRLDGVKAAFPLLGL
tara:strand:+ start:126 stop:461 length:336 start_codon:yes stop_codon:yes gene_type:complete